MKKIFIIFALLLSGCINLTNEEVVAKVKYCDDHNMDVYLKMDGVTREVFKVVCLPKNRINYFPNTQKQVN